jgi:hypothetical protein
LCDFIGTAPSNIHAAIRRLIMAGDLTLEWLYLSLPVKHGLLHYVVLGAYILVGGAVG